MFLTPTRFLCSLHCLCFYNYLRYGKKSTRVLMDSWDNLTTEGQEIQQLQKIFYDHSDTYLTIAKIAVMQSVRDCRLHLLPQQVSRNNHNNT